jgi:hypothetical protein
MNVNHLKVLLGTISLAVGVVASSGCNSDKGTTETTTTQGDGDGDGEGETTPEPETGDGDPSADSNNPFVEDQDIGGAPVCDPWAQDCPEGEKCAAFNSGGDTWDANKCVPVLGDGQAGDQCTYDGSVAGTDSCDLGHMCYYVGNDGFGFCVPLCTGEAASPMCPDNYNCSISNDGSLLLCLFSCDPLLQDCAQEGSGCFWDGSVFNCDPAGDIPEGEPCGYINDCAPGHVCLSSESHPSCSGSACCSGFCDLTGPQCLIAGTECLPFFDEGTAPPGLEDVGVCVLPGS